MLILSEAQSRYDIRFLEPKFDSKCQHNKSPDCFVGINIVEKPLMKTLDWNVSMYRAPANATNMSSGTSNPVPVSHLPGMGKPRTTMGLTNRSCQHRPFALCGFAVSFSTLYLIVNLSSDLCFFGCIEEPVCFAHGLIWKTPVPGGEGCKAAPSQAICSASSTKNSGIPLAFMMTERPAIVAENCKKLDE